MRVCDPRLSPTSIPLGTFSLGKQVAQHHVFKSSDTGTDSFTLQVHKNLLHPSLIPKQFLVCLDVDGMGKRTKKASQQTQPVHGMTDSPKTATKQTWRSDCFDHVKQKKTQKAGMRDFPQCTI